MLTKWEQLEAWLRDNNFTRWILWKENPAEHPDGKGNFKILDSVQFAVSDFEDKIAMTKKYLTMSGGRAWAVGTGKTAGETICEIRLEQDNYTPGATAGVGMTQDAIRKNAVKLDSATSVLVYPSGGRILVSCVIPSGSISGLSIAASVTTSICRFSHLGQTRIQSRI